MVSLLPGTIASSIEDVDHFLDSQFERDWMRRVNWLVMTHQLTVAWSASDLPRFDEEDAELQLWCDVGGITLQSMLDQADELRARAANNRQSVKDGELKALFRLLDKFVHYNCGRDVENLVAADASETAATAGATASAGPGVAVGVSLLAILVALVVAYVHFARRRGSASLSDGSSTAGSEASTEPDAAAVDRGQSAWLQRRDSHLVDIGRLTGSKAQLPTPNVAEAREASDKDEQPEESFCAQQNSLAHLNRVRSAATLLDTLPVQNMDDI